MIKTQNDFSLVRTVVDEKLDIDVITNKRRFRYIVDAKKIYTYLLFKQGHRPLHISKKMKMDHATILYYLKNFEHQIDSDKKFKDQYEACKLAYDKYRNVDSGVTPLRDLLGTSINKYTEENRFLNKELQEQKVENFKALKTIESLKQKLANHLKEHGVNEYTQKKLFPLYNIIKERTKAGSEHDMSIRINRLYN